MKIIHRPYLMLENGTEMQTLPEELREGLHFDELRFRFQQRRSTMPRIFICK
jgi:hypothetical protein